jgi:hypothetical protein
MNSVVFLEWFENPLMPALKNPNLVVLDNASYHNVKTEDTVCSNSSPGDRAKKKYVCLWSPDRPYFVADDPNVFNRQLFDPNFS